MRLICDDYNTTYYYVDDDTGAHLSPHFDYEVDAIQWKFNIENKIYEQLKQRLKEQQ